MVVAFHLNAGTHLHVLFADGSVGVDFFFVLSGFIIAAAYGERVTSLGALGSGLIRRVGRLYPLHLAVLAVWVAFVVATSLATGASAFTGGFSLESLGENLLLVQGFTPHRLTWNFTAWSVSVELWVNVVYFLLILGAGRRLVVAEALLCIAGLAVGAVAFLGHIEPSPQVAVWIAVVHYALGFFLGALLFRFYRLCRARGWRPPTWLSAIALAVGLAPFLAAAAIPDPVMPLMFAVLVFAFAFDEGPLQRRFAGRAGQWAGTISYSIYLIHPVFTVLTYDLILALGRRLDRPAMREVAGRQLLVLGGPWAMDLALLLCLACTIAAAGVTYRLIEDPARRWANALSRRVFGSPRAATP